MTVGVTGVLAFGRRPDSDRSAPPLCVCVLQREPLRVVERPVVVDPAGPGVVAPSLMAGKQESGWASVWVTRWGCPDKRVFSSRCVRVASSCIRKSPNVVSLSCPSHSHRYI